jgi:large subunit GTPase 1
VVGSKASEVPAVQKLGSVLEATSLVRACNYVLFDWLHDFMQDEFITAAVLTERDFTAKREKQHAFILDDDLPMLRPRRKIADFSFEHLTVPRRPVWQPEQTAAELDRKEKEAFYAWRREIASIEEVHDTRKVTPYEKNIEVWRQLWRVLERSDIVLQIVDARNPLFYYSRDLVKYSRELKPPRPMLILVNKSDYLTDKQRQIWAEFFLREG